MLIYALLTFMHLYKKAYNFSLLCFITFLICENSKWGCNPSRGYFPYPRYFRLVTLLSFLLSRAHRNGLYNETHWSGKSIHWYVMFWTFYWIFVVTQWHAHFHKILEKRPRGFFCTFKSTLKFVHMLLPGVI